jgi:hypothetical protein
MVPFILPSSTCCQKKNERKLLKMSKEKEDHSRYRKWVVAEFVEDILRELGEIDGFAE